MNTHSPPQSPQLAGESRRANTNDPSSTRVEESPQLAGGFFNISSPLSRRQVLKLVGLSLLGLKMFGDPRAWAFMARLNSPGDAELVKGSRIMMGNVSVTLTAVSSDRKQARKAIAAAFSEMDRLENLMSIFKPESEFSQINEAAGDHPVKVSPEVMEVIKRGFEVAHLTEGAFNMAMGPAIRLWDFLGKKHIPTPKEMTDIRRLCRPEDIVIDEQRQEIFLKQRGMVIDPGGIGKGYIAERAKQVMLEQGISSGIIAAAGDLVLFGNKPDGQPWRIGVQHPRRDREQIAYIEMTDCAISTSGDYERFFTKDGQIYHHILDPKNLFPARGCQSVTVVSRDGLFADALATGIFVLGPEKGSNVLKGGALGKAIMIDKDGGMTVSPELEQQVHFS